jgi:ketosteroid isomerase-like protein
MNGFLSIPACVAVVLTLASAGHAAQATGRFTSPLETVRTLVTAIETADLDLLLSTFHGDATIFMPATEMRWAPESPGSPTLLSGIAQIREAMSALFAGARAAGSGPRYFILRPRDESVQAFGDTAIVTFHLGSLSTRSVNEPATLARRSFVLRREGDRWLIVHHHGSNAQIVSAPR